MARNKKSDVLQCILIFVIAVPFSTSLSHDEAEFIPTEQSSDRDLARPQRSMLPDHSKPNDVLSNRIDLKRYLSRRSQAKKDERLPNKITRQVDTIEDEDFEDVVPNEDTSAIEDNTTSSVVDVTEALLVFNKDRQAESAAQGKSGADLLKLANFEGEDRKQALNAYLDETLKLNRQTENNLATLREFLQRSQNENEETSRDGTKNLGSKKLGTGKKQDNDVNIRINAAPPLRISADTSNGEDSQSKVHPQMPQKQIKAQHQLKIQQQRKFQPQPKVQLQDLRPQQKVKVQDLRPQQKVQPQQKAQEQYDQLQHEI